MPFTASSRRCWRSATRLWIIATGTKSATASTTITAIFIAAAFMPILPGRC